MSRATSYIDGLTDEVCRTLLGSRHVGRVAFVGDDGYPVVLPVNYAVDGGFIVIRTDRGGIYEHVPLHHVAFEVDDFDEATRTGWSLLVKGAGREITDTLADAYETGIHRTPTAWAPGDKNRVLAIDIAEITGRQIVRS
jgi:nitroimidazol reductase NimA-like FMN-containing flavoprotein (pyridoxamine 5'-phosphate oxidase superfamily)